MTIYQLETLCPVCQCEESIISTLPQIRCGNCGAMTKTIYQGDITEKFYTRPDKTEICPLEET